MITVREAAVISAYTGYLLGGFEALQNYAEELLGRPVFTHELGSPTVVAQLRKLAYQDFIQLKVGDRYAVC